MKRKKYQGVPYPTARKDTTSAFRPTNIKYLRVARVRSKNIHRALNIPVKTKRDITRAYRQEKIEARSQLKQHRGR